jgi:hypothetical protein
VPFVLWALFGSWVFKTIVLAAGIRYILLTLNIRKRRAHLSTRHLYLNIQYRIFCTRGANEADSMLKDPLGDGSFTFVALRLDELKQGQYEIYVRFNGTASRLSVVDNSGEEYAA